ncbi:N-formylglutamate deformylase [Bordetella sp. FB-8]|uniref:N-formylglutamate deformylase n=1 Tax=Bordetella sp. FB-8 TaxID=1159870 RepID=UPI0003746684|nr:N-formylglutamate deformylase [Bordetella sp. FB-8]
MSITDRPAFHFHQGTEPLLLSMPHSGTYIPPGIAAHLSENARHVPDTDWHLERLYEFARQLGASILVATHSRYVIDLNRPPDGASLYPGQATTGLCPTSTFDATAVYRSKADEPGDAEIAERRETVWCPYHAKLEQELKRIRAEHGVAGLWDAHSIRSVLPQFFEGKLPDLNFGTNRGATCDAALTQALTAVAGEASGYTWVLNGRYTGGYITRHYGRPLDGVHAVQLEMCQSTYMQETPPFDYLPHMAAGIQPHLQRMLQAMLHFLRSKAI